MINWKEKMKGFLVFVVIICMAFLLNVYAQNEVVPEVLGPLADHVTIVQEVPEVVQPKTEPEPTRLNVTIIDGMNDDKLVKLENCMVHVKGKLHIVEDTFNYSNTFLEGDRYEITIHVKLKK